ncbi:hypothetical protein HMPREF1981_01614 [Bacteroides pyogenes F0041]|uniref:Uncharacterized protein n=1 Tax=Bacteroides pyogenes F0041 TaxID=1321819 RepID=U2DV71_9BACE|nr:hypothetical protein HMPREF1981_01614 [Bacteroides pyogenes F0041]
MCRARKYIIANQSLYLIETKALFGVNQGSLLRKQNLSFEQWRSFLGETKFFF